ncbi:helix-turn-helix transcriptional regulator [Exiguobacterium profundum]|uniref:helix-turn-helix transcriptional regulator n=1 Tax=Exiguobacterium TaxID=33986 RepID=UPI00093F20BA|nr:MULTISPECIES: helix-turn-helix transcriptional regulator [Exiguobacterium]MCT4797238.1 helix-turn-helix domain-containing protein [Exiguobacterium profundum]MCV9898661.1 helix-turn-helix domain-containing protein [Exiguobacterium sp. N5]MDT0190967.1 helix-turn-helix transcriptional regulator [Exiguobacterium sp. BG5(2022)]QPI66933.1 helix-turn-helix transcriptional regulator [Exiguobacterium sp. PBE]
MNCKLKKRLKQLRLENKYSQQQIADKLNITRQAVSKWENGKSIPDIENLKLLCEIYNVSLDNILENSVLTEEKINVRKNSVRSEMRHCALVLTIVASYFLAPFGFITLAAVLFFMKRTDEHRLLLTFLSLMALIKNIHSTYYI